MAPKLVPSTVRIEGAPGPVLQGLHHVQLAMPRGEEDAARRFYHDALGISEVPKPPNLAARGGCWFESGALRIHLGVENDFRPAKKAHPAILVQGLQQLKQVLTRNGYTLREDEPLEGYDRVFVDDPFGNRLELLESL
jgi:catechol 2,3-dioxygenase-like lactoylglutathione lyase family enzyme